MRLFNSFLVALTALLAAGSAGALVSIDHVATSPVTDLAPGALVTVQVRLNWNGAGALQGAFSSTTFDSSVLEFVSNTTAPASILGFIDNTDPDNPLIIPGLNRFTTSLKQPGDPDSVLRTVQFGGLDPADARAATTGTGRLIMTLTFRALNPGSSSVLALIANGDTGATGDSWAPGSSVNVTVIPEPGTALLMGLGLAGLGLAGRRS